jgi:uncharacterized delta-60 repeat protein
MFSQDGTLDVSFNTGTGFDDNDATNHINSVAIVKELNNGNIIVGGDFNWFNETQKPKLVILNNAGQFVSNLGSTTGNYSTNIVCIEEDENSFIYCAGGKSGVSSKKIYKLYPNGTLDASFSSSIGFDGNSYVTTLAIQNDNKIIVGGSLNSFNGILINHILRLNNDGSIDNSFNVGSGFNNYVTSIKVQDDGKIVVGGTFTSFNGNTCNRIVRLNSDGSIDSNFNVGSGFNSVVRKIFIQEDLKVLVTGAFSNFNGLPCYKLIRLNSDGSLDSTFSSNVDSNTIEDIIVRNDNKILVSGSFQYIGAIFSQGIGLLNENGSFNNYVANLTGFNYLSTIRSLCFQSDGKLLIGGDFNFGSTIKRGACRLNYTNVLSEETPVFNKIVFYPNPSNKTLYLKIDNNETINELNIYDISGKNILQSKEVFNNQIDVSSFLNGVYLVSIKTRDGVYKGKFVKN